VPRQIAAKDKYTFRLSLIGPERLTVDMVTRKAHEVDSWLKSPDAAIASVLVYGPDRGLVSERARVFAASTGLPLDDVFTVARFSAADLADDPGRLLDDARTVPMFGGKRLVWVRDIPPSGPLVDAVGDLVASPPDETLLLVEAGDLKKTARLRSLFEKSGSSIALPCYGDGVRDIDRLIDEEIGASGMTITLEARQALKRLLGGDRLASRGEIAKLLLYAHGKRQIGLEDVAAAVGDASALSQDEIVDAILKGSPAEMDTAYSRMIATGVPPFLSLAATARQFQALQTLRGEVENDRKTAAAAVASSRPPIFFSRRAVFETAVGAFDMAFINRSLDRLHKATLRSRQHPDLAVPLVRQALLALSLEAAAEMRRLSARR
jgi:DNA polymerase-3 subunit delta